MHRRGEDDSGARHTRADDRSHQIVYALLPVAYADSYVAIGQVKTAPNVSRRGQDAGTKTSECKPQIQKLT